MKRVLTTQLLIFALLIVGLRVPGVAQPQPAPANEPVTSDSADIDLIKTKSDLRSVFAKKTAEYNKRALNFDLKKTEKEERKQQPKKKFWSKTNTTFLVLFIVGTAALVFLIAKYYHKCIRTNYPDCTPGVDESCVCEEYEKRVKD